MILIDTSAWIEFFRVKGDPAFKARVADLISHHLAAYTCAVRFELFFGAKPHELEDLTTGLGFAKRIPLTPDHWDRAASIGAKMRGIGYQIPASDLLIATVAHTENLPLLANDAHFDQIKKHLLPGLKLLQP